ncbi:SDR family oxidoreductase [Pseudomonas sp.]|uniref:SDR family NAD(P)-dependent oxidoreductase n=1 Tax=Pseudomonas sp. TaxID=306 RepID=UPI0028AC5E67|nr:SDR family oxidoreductase [Pseudomonas sp.]
MDLGIEGRVALITGAGGGIGRATAQLLAGEGVRLVLIDRDTERLQDVAANHAEVLLQTVDVTDESQVRNAVRAAEQKFGAVDIVLHASGITGAKGDPLELDDNAYREAWETDFLSAVHVARATIPAMRQRGWGRFVAVTSENAVQPYWDEIVYNVAKAGLASFIKGLSYREAKFGVLCNTVAPAFIETPMTDQMMEKRAEDMGVGVKQAVDSFLDEERPGIVQHRRGQPEEVAAAIALLVSARASFINGANLRVDGGSVQAVQN